MTRLSHQRGFILVALLGLAATVGCVAPSGASSPALTSVAPGALAPAPTAIGAGAAPTPGRPAVFVPKVTASANTTVVPPTPEPVPVYTYQVVKTYAHDPNAFTQGLVYEDGILFEGTGLNGRSSLREVDLETGKVLQMIQLPAEFFGEGITLLNDRIYQLTWQSHVGFVYDSDTFQQVDTFTYATEGWGLTHDGKRLIMSDGTATLHFLDPKTLQETGQVAVRSQNQPVERLNELEYIDGEVYANIWQTNWIARIDPDTGQVTGWIDLSGLLQPGDITQPVDVLNGIAHDEARDRLFVTGKLWPKLFEIDLVARAP